LPVPDEDVKNFSVNEIIETESGFKIAVNWGGGNYFYSRNFYFTFKENQFYFDSIKINNYIQDTDKKINTTKIISPSISIDKFDILLYLENGE
jgi:hypothetical protein